MRYYKKMFFVFTCIAVIYMLLIESIFITGYRILSKNEFERSMDATMQQMADFTDFRLQFVQETHMLLRNSEYVTKYLQEDISEPDRFARLKLSKYVTSIFGIAPSQKNALGVTKVVDDYAILHDGTGDLSFLKSKFFLNDSEFDEITRYFQENPEKQLKFLGVTDNDGKRMYVVVRHEWLGRTYPLYIFTSFYEDQLFYSKSDRHGTFSMFYYNTFVGSRGMLSAAEVEALARSPEESGLSYRISTSSQTGISYIYFEEPFSLFTPVFYLIIGVGIIAITASVLLMLLITKKMYAPIKGVLRTTDANISSGDEFVHIKDTILALHSDVEVMSHSLEKYNASLEHKFYQDLLLGLTTSDEIREGTWQHQALARTGPFAAVLIKYTETAELQPDLSHNMAFEIKQKLTLVFDSIFQGKSFYRLINLNFENQVILINEDNSDSLSEKLRNALLVVEPDYGLEITAFVGTLCDSLDSLFHSYRQAVRLADLSLFSSHNAKVITPNDIKGAWKDTVYYPLATERNLINAIIHGKTAIWEAAIDEIMNTNQNSRPNDISQLPLMLTATVNRIIDGLNNPISELFGEDTVIYLEFRSCHSYEELHKKALSVFGTLAYWFEKKEAHSTGGIASRMLEYLHQNYNRDISLFNLAEHLNMSQNYVSTLFKNETGHNFKDYLLEYRYKMACELIKKHTGKKIKDIAELVGCNTGTLTRLFVRYAGMTPSEYQQKLYDGEDASD